MAAQLILPICPLSGKQVLSSWSLPGNKVQHDTDSLCYFSVGAWCTPYQLYVQVVNQKVMLCGVWSPISWMTLGSISPDFTTVDKVRHVVYRNLRCGGFYNWYFTIKPWNTVTRECICDLYYRSAWCQCQTKGQTTNKCACRRYSYSLTTFSISALSFEVLNNIQLLVIEFSLQFIRLFVICLLLGIPQVFIAPNAL